MNLKIENSKMPPLPHKHTHTQIKKLKKEIYSHQFNDRVFWIKLGSVFKTVVYSQSPIASHNIQSNQIKNIF